MRDSQHAVHRIARTSRPVTATLYDISIRCNQMTVEERYRERYKSGDTPWDVSQPDFNLKVSGNRGHPFVIK